MGKASITIAIGALWNGSTQLDKVNGDLSRMAKIASQNTESTTRSLALQGESWYNLGTSIYDTGKRVADFGDSLTKKVTVPMSIVGGYCVKQATNFDTAIANLRKTSDLTEDQLKALGDAALDASTKQPVDAATIVNIEAMGAQLGIADDNLQSFAKTVSGLDIATNMDADTAATEMARFANITGMSESQFENYGSTIVAIGNNMATTESEVSSLAQRFASSGTAAGMSQADILGLSGALSSLGVKAEMGGSALSQTINAIGVAVSNGGDDLQAFADAAGMTADEFAQAWGDDAAGTFNTLVEEMGKSVAAGGDVNVMLSDLGITGIRQSDVMRRLVDSTEAVTGKQSVLAGALDLSRNAWEENTALQKEVDQRNESMQSRLDVLKNKVNEVAITVGTPLTEALIDALDALQPLFQGVADAAQAFADMDEQDQRAILSMAGIAAAAGPVLSTFGRIVEGIGNVNAKLGESKQSAAVFGDASKTVDGSLMRIYDSSKDTAAQLGIARNEAAKAAGSAETYVNAWEKMTDSAKVVRDTTEKITSLTTENDRLSESIDKIKTGAANAGEALTTEQERVIKASEKAISSNDVQVSKLTQTREAAKGVYEENANLVTSWSKSTSEAEKAAAGIDQLSNNLKNVKTNAGNLATVTNESGKMGGAVGKASTAVKDMAAKASDAASNLKTGLVNGLKLSAASALDMAKNFATATLRAGAISLAIAGVSAAIAYLIDDYQKVAQHNENLKKATDGLTQATNRSIKAATDQTVAYSENKVSLSDAREAVDKATESQAQLADTIAQGNSSASAQIGQLQAAYEVIQEYANQSGLTTTEQGKLKAAVEQFNDVAGTSIEVTDAANGKLAENGEAIDNVATKLGEYVKAKTEQVKMDAYSERLKSMYEQQAQDLESLTKAQKAYNDAMDGKTLQTYIDKAQELGDRLGWTQTQVDEYAQATYDAADAEARVKSGLDDAKNNLDAINGSITNTEAAMGAATAAANGFSDSVYTFAQANSAISSACSGAGVDLQQFASQLADTGVSTEQLKDVTDEQWTQILAAYDGNSDSIVATLEQLGIDMGDSGDRAVNALADAMLSGSEDVSGAEAQLIQAARSGDWSGLLADMQEHGFDIPKELADALESNSGAPSAAADEMLQLVAIKLAGGDLDEAAEILGGDIDSGLAEGIENGTLSEEQAALLGDDVIEKAKESLDSHSPSKKFEQIGSDVDAGLANGINGNTDGPATAAFNLGQSVINGIGDIASKLFGTGNDAGAGFTSGLDAYDGVAMVSGNTLSLNASNGASGTATALSTEGSNAGSGFAAGIGAYSGSAYSNAYGLYASATGATSGTPGALSGYGSAASSGFASGMGANVHAVLQQANAIANNAMQAKNYGNSHVWGSDLASNFASGIRAGIGWVREAANAIASAAANILHFSVPEEGPWSGSERGGATSGLHLAQNFASGIMGGIPEVKSAALSLASAATIPVPTLGASAVGVPASMAGDRGGKMGTVNNWNLTINGAHMNDASPRAQQLITELFGEFGLSAQMGV